MKNGYVINNSGGREVSDACNLRECVFTQLAASILCHRLIEILVGHRKKSKVKTKRLGLRAPFPANTAWPSA